MRSHPVYHFGSRFCCGAIRLARCIMTRATVLLFMLLLAACSDQTPPTQAVNEMIESPLQNTVISSADHYPPEPIISTGSINDLNRVALNLMHRTVCVIDRW